ncbi:potassium voltage-gated channel subfamily H member 6 isoform X3 [Folsomia candida]|uniref:potassium voltage-gated channel subfamily H member 6 isoform X3 n=1 Tax=Folsomia candida TaxID=158441 RepID=UPI0016051FE9|nr:potassium voltage-gated channel subfamily H member 6 isoform X3 [Folsomia candida]
MPIRKGHVVPPTTLIESIIRKFDSQNRNYVLGNAQSPECAIIYCSDLFCRLTGYTRAEVMQKGAICAFLHGPLTAQSAILQIQDSLISEEEQHVETVFYKKDGSRFYCSNLIAPVRDENGDICLYLLNFENLSSTTPEEGASPTEVANHLLSRFDRAKQTVRRSLRRKRPSSLKSRLAAAPSLPPIPASDAVELVSETQDRPLEQRRRPSFKHSNSDLSLRPTTLDTTGNGRQKPHLQGGFRRRDDKRNRQAFPGSSEPSTGGAYPDQSGGGAGRGWSAPPEDQECTPSTVASQSQLRATSSLEGIGPVSTKLVQPMPSRSTTVTNPKRALSSNKKGLPNVSNSDSDLARHRISLPDNRDRCREKKSPSLSNLTHQEGLSKYKMSIQENGSGKLFQVKVGEKVAQVLSLGADVLPEYRLQSPRIHKWTILHYSPFKAVWDWLILILVMYTAIVTPYVAAFLLNEPDFAENKQKPYSEDPIVVVDFIVDIMFIVDILINFRTTYVNANDEVVSNPGRIAVHYFRGWFIIDLVAAIPFDLLLYLFGTNTDETTTLIGLLKTARLLRLVRVARKIDRYSEYGAAVLLLLMATFALIAHWLACIWYAIGNAERTFSNPGIGWLDHLANDTHQFYGFDENNKTVGPTLKSRYVTALYFTFSSLTSVGFGNVSPNTDAEKMFTIAVMLVGSLMYASIFGNVSAIIQRLYSGTARYHTQMLRVREFIRFHQIPNPLRQRLEEYFQHAWTYTNGIDMNSVLKGFPECLQADICLHLNRNLLNSCPAFKDASQGCLRALSMKFKTTHAPPGDTLVHRGDVLTALYFISRGSIEILKGPLGSQQDIVMAILSKDDIFGENPCIHPTIGKSSCNVRALTYCDLHKILRDDLLDVLDMYPEFANSFSTNLEITFNLRDEELSGVDPRIARHKSFYGASCSSVEGRESDVRKKAYKPPRLRRRKREKPTDSMDGSTDEEERIGMERTLIDACRRLTSTNCVELAPDLADIDMTPLSRDFGEQQVETNGNNKLTTSVLVEQVKKDSSKSHRRSITHSYPDADVSFDSDAPIDIHLHRRIDHLSRKMEDIERKLGSDIHTILIMMKNLQPSAKLGPEQHPMSGVATKPAKVSHYQQPSTTLLQPIISLKDAPPTASTSQYKLRKAENVDDSEQIAHDDVPRSTSHSSKLNKSWTDNSREDSKGSEPDSWDISEAPIARLDASLEDIDRPQDDFFRETNNDKPFVKSNSKSSDV